jgi:DNA-binding response OmpR family regulator
MDKVLIIEDEKDINDALRYSLEKEGYKVFSANDGIRGLFSALKTLPDLVILDLMLPGMNGMDICRKLKADPKTADIPVVILSAKSSEADKIGCFELGADDYVTKPFSTRELISRIKAVGKRCSQAGTKVKFLKLGDLEIDPAGHCITVKGEEIELSLKEFGLLHDLALHKGQVLTRKQLLKDVWGIEASIDTRTVDVHVTRLRRKLKRSSCKIDTVHGIGYKLYAA